MKKSYGSLRWILLAAGVLAILGLTGMNVYSLYALHENTLESDRENKKLQVAEFADKVRFRFFAPFSGLSTMDINRLENNYRDTGQFTPEVTQLLKKAARDSMYNGIYFIPSGSDACHQDEPVLKYYRSPNTFRPDSSYSDIICDGMDIARTQMKTLLPDYPYTNKVIFDSHRSVTLALVNLSEQDIFGYLIMPFNQYFLTEHYLPRQLYRNFGDSVNSGMNVWLRDWTSNKLIATSDSTSTYERENIQFEQSFPDFFDYWKMEVSFVKAAAVTASNESLIKNLFVLGAAVLLLLGALVFMFFSAQKERALAQRQAGFLANVTHELKTPLAVMQAAGENLSDGRVENLNRVQSYGTHIYNESIRLRQMIEKLLDIAKVDAGQSLIEPKPANVGELVRSYLTSHRKFLQKKGFTIETTIPKDLPLVMLDTNSFSNILSNLVDNAIKYSRDDKFLGIRLNSEGKHLQLKVEDYGIGISKKDQAHIFDKFYRAEDPLTAQTKGHGLGLSIVKNLVELNNGKITLTSTPGEGSTFIVTFPTFTGPAGEPPQELEQLSSEQIKKTLKKESEEYVG